MCPHSSRLYHKYMAHEKSAPATSFSFEFYLLLFPVLAYNEMGVQHTYIGDGHPDALQHHGRTCATGEVGLCVPLDVNGGRSESCRDFPDEHGNWHMHWGWGLPSMRGAHWLTISAISDVLLTAGGAPASFQGLDPAFSSTARVAL